MKKPTCIILTCILSGMLYADRQVGDARKYRRDGDTDFGLMESIDSLGVQLQFEDTGLRTKIKWKARSE